MMKRRRRNSPCILPEVDPHKHANPEREREREREVDKKLAPRNVLQRQNAANIDHGVNSFSNGSIASNFDHGTRCVSIFTAGSVPSSILKGRTDPAEQIPQEH